MIRDLRYINSFFFIMGKLATAFHNPIPYDEGVANLVRNHSKRGGGGSMMNYRLIPASLAGHIQVYMTVHNSTLIG